jgi:putative heme-binding domain-containing protein
LISASFASSAVRSSRYACLKIGMACAALVVVAAGAVLAQDGTVGSSRDGDSALRAENGARIFGASCAGCHSLNGRGGVLGPDLSRIAQSQPAASLAQAVRDPNASIVVGYRAVTLVTRDGRRIRGVLKGQDAFSIQIMDVREQLRGFLKANLREVISETSSLMPAFGPDRLSDRDLEDLLRFMTKPRAVRSTDPQASGR